jgi:hypothetical protein
MRNALLLCVGLALLGGCTGAPEVAEPVAPSELAQLVRALNDGLDAASSYRGTGSGEITVSGRTVDVAFAVVYDRPGWLRADLRPALGTMGTSLTSLALMEGECARLYLPARLLVVHGCFSDVAGLGDWSDPASFVLGLPDAGFLERLTDVRSSRSRGRLVLEGRSGESSVRIEADDERHVITRVELARPDSDERMRIEYSGHGWKGNPKLPQTVKLSTLEGTTRELRITIRYDTLRSGEPADRSSYDLGVPEGALEIDWRELDIWR